MTFRTCLAKAKYRLIRFLREFPYREYRKIDGFLVPEDAACLYRTARKLKPGSTILEIGSWKGKSTYCLARGLRAGKVIAVDPFDASGEAGSSEIYEQEKHGDLETQFSERMKSLSVFPMIEIWRGRSSDFADREVEIDFLFIDGDHSVEGCRHDHETYSPKVKRGGFVAFHDYQKDRKDFGPTWVIENLVIPSGDFDFIEQSGSVWVGRKR